MESQRLPDSVSRKNLEKLFMEYSEEWFNAHYRYLRADAQPLGVWNSDKVRELEEVRQKKEQKVDSVLDLYIDLGYLAVNVVQ